jgi:hypothetical protein
MQKIQFVSMMILIQIRLMKAKCKLQNMIVQASRPDMESQLIEAPNAKTRLIQFLSMTSLTQMKLIKVIRNIKNTILQEFQLNVESKLI